MDVRHDVGLLLLNLVAFDHAAAAAAAAGEHGVGPEHFPLVAFGEVGFLHEFFAVPLFLFHDLSGEHPPGELHGAHLVPELRGREFLLARPFEDLLKGRHDAVGDVLRPHEFQTVFLSSRLDRRRVGHDALGKGRLHGVGHVARDLFRVLEAVAAEFRLAVMELTGGEIARRRGLPHHADVAVEGVQLFPDVMPETRVEHPRVFVGLGRTGHVDHGARELSCRVEGVQQINEGLRPRLVVGKEGIVGVAVHLAVAVDGESGPGGVAQTDVLGVDHPAAVARGGEAVAVGDGAGSAFFPRLLDRVGDLPPQECAQFRAVGHFHLVGIIADVVGAGARVGVGGVDDEFFDGESGDLLFQDLLRPQQDVRVHADHVAGNESDEIPAAFQQQTAGVDGGVAPEGDPQIELALNGDGEIRSKRASAPADVDGVGHEIKILCESVIS